MMIDVPFFFGRILDDSISNEQDVWDMAYHASKMTKRNVWVYSAPRNSVRHGRISTLTEHKYFLKLFLQKECTATKSTKSRTTMKNYKNLNIIGYLMELETALDIFNSEILQFIISFIL
jgi:hypothetical protein